EFENTVVKTDQGRLVRLRDVAEIELGAQSYDQTCTLDGRPSVALSIYQLPGSNALSVAQSVRAKMEELKDRFPAGVDYAIVVVEAVEHHIEHGLSPRDATIKAMQQVSGPVIAVGLVLSAVFIPCVFISGITGQFFQQFAWTIAVSTLISAFNSLTLSPALAALLLRPRVKGKFAALPWFAFVPFGAWLGHKAGSHRLGAALAALPWDGSPAVLDALR